VDSRPKIEIVEWVDSPHPMVSPRRKARRFFSPSTMGMMGTVILHALIVPSAYLEIQAHQAKPPKIPQEGALRIDAPENATDLVLLVLPTIPSSGPSMMASAVSQFVSDQKPLKMPLDLDVSVPSALEILPLNEDQALAAQANGGDGIEQARLFGIYTGQLQARIERIWSRPRGPIYENDEGDSPTSAAASFQCQVQIVQDVRGNVQEILLPQCNGSVAWQQSLVMAIRQTSPLPKPPSSIVSSRSIALTFIGLPYADGSAEDEYDARAIRIANSGGTTTQ
jgi:hypothetical protein